MVTKSKHKGVMVRQANCSIEDVGDEYLVGFYSKTQNFSDRLVTKDRVKWFAKALLDQNTLPPQKKWLEIRKTKLMHYIWNHVSHLKRYVVHDTKHGTVIDGEQAEVIYAGMFQGGLNRKEYYVYYWLPLKVLEFYDCLETDQHHIMVDIAQTKKFMNTKLKKYGG